METFAAVVGWDWADRENALSLRERGTSRVEKRQIGGRPEDLHGWASEMLDRFKGQRIAVGIDAGRGAVISAFMGYPHLVMYPINPASAASLRRALYPSGKKDDPVDSDVLLEMVDKHGERLRPLAPADPLTRELGMLSEDRRKLDNDRKREVNRLRDVLKSYYPQALDLFEDLSTALALDFLEQWPCLESAQRARDTTLVKFFHEHRCRSQQRITHRIERIRSATHLTSDEALLHAGTQRVRAYVTVIRALQQAIAELDRVIGELYHDHPEYQLIESFPGVGEVLGPRLIAVLGSDRDRWESPEALQRLTGTAPITVRTGGKDGPVSIRRRLRKPKFMHQTFVEWAGCSLQWSPWARAYYDLCKERNPKARHYVILRALAFKWQRILFRCWLGNTPFQELVHQTELARRGSPIANRISKDS